MMDRPTMMAAILAVSTVGMSTLGCASVEPQRSAESKPTVSASHPSHAAEFGDDPVGVAHRWASRLPGSIPSDGPDTLSSVLKPWDQARVVRLVRVAPDDYRGVVATSVASGQKAAIVTIRPGPEGDWRVETVEVGASTAYWPTL